MSRRTTCGPGGLAGLNSAQGSGPGTLAPSAMNGEGFEVFGLRSSVPGSATLQDSWWSFLARSLFFRGATTTKEPPAQLAVTVFYILVLPTPKFRPKGCTTIVRALRICILLDSWRNIWMERAAVRCTELQFGESSRLTLARP